MQLAPFVFFGTHVPPLQKLVALHCALVVQEVGQLEDDPLHTKLPQPFPGLPLASGVQLPTLPARL
ncbi:MAG: hypothetical protein ACJ790_21710, partial [Myxococcaceae bacterium]